ncbi:MAG: UDP-N-acetylmuramate dehydrogenase [Ruminococcus sp.]|nr:UDP-N-acetylmuramate dehydrogenase [Ruminococcus sp.]
MNYLDELAEQCRISGCDLKTDRLLSAYTTFKIGGECPAVVEINSAETAAHIAEWLKERGIKFAVLGRGSNIIASDNGFDGVILHFGSDFSEITVNGCTITAQAGASLSAVCRAAQENGLTGMENLYGIPGTVGGGLYMNAGAYGTEMKDVVSSAGYLDPAGKSGTMMLPEMKLSYRHSAFSENNCIVTSVTFSLKKGDKDEIKSAMTECLGKRTSKQPLEYPSAGSTFKRPEGSYASLLIEQCGLKGYTVGGAQVSEKHSGFVINIGGASAEDVLKLCGDVKKVVREKTGYVLELEPIILE